ncbi:orotate phosphoribosyltransferase [bacterium]|nr:orotate phosphoribosyltransferase [bacterium]
MEQYKKDFILFMVESNVLTFGDFITKSGRKTPFFINTGKYRTGAQIAKLGEFYAEALIKKLGANFDVLFGPAYKGIPLVVTASSALHRTHDNNVAFCFNRKEVKDHGEGGSLVGHPLQDGDRVVIVEDVTTAGTSVRESVPILKHAANVTLAGLVVSVDRMERGTGTQSALQELAEAFDMPTFAIVTMAEVIEFLYNKEIDGKVLLDDTIKSAIEDYYKIYGV